MKKVNRSILIVFALSIHLANAQKPEETAKFEKLNLKPLVSVMDEQRGRVDEGSRALRMNRNESFKSDAKDASGIALSFLQAREVFNKENKTKS